MPLQPSVQTIKRLFGESGNLCAFPNCTLPIVTDSAPAGEVCHIKGSKPGSPRYDSAQSDDERHGYENLVLMCGFHHSVIDSDEVSYTVERLLQIKSAHKQRAKEMPDDESEKAARILFVAPTVSNNQSGGITASVVTINHNYGNVGRDEAGRIFSKPTFQLAQAGEGEARFRKKGEALGISMDRLDPDHPEIRLTEGKALWLRLIPTEPLPNELGLLDLKNAAMSNDFPLRPLYGAGLHLLQARDGFGTYSQLMDPKAHITSGVAFAFTTGEVWSIDTILLSFDKKIYVDAIEKALAQGLRAYSSFLAKLQIRPPYKWIAGVEGVSRMQLVYEGQGNLSEYFGGPICMGDPVAKCGYFEGSEDAATALSPFIDELFKKSCAERPTRSPR